MNNRFGKMGEPETIGQLFNQAFYWAYQDSITMPLSEVIERTPEFTQQVISYALSAFITKCFTDNLCKGYYPDMIRKVIKADKFYLENLQENLDQFKDEA